MALNSRKNRIRIGAKFEEEIPRLHPTQFRVGEVEATEKKNLFIEMGAQKLEAYLKAHPCPIVIGPDGTPYVTDEQHRATAGTEAEHHHALHGLERHGRPTMFAIVKDSYPAYLRKCKTAGTTPLAFGAWMVKNNYTFLNNRGSAHPFEALPDAITAMKNDAYRSLSGFLERKAYQLKPGVYFAQFKVADWLRAQLGLSDKQVDQLLRGKKGKAQARKEKFIKKVGCLLTSVLAKDEPWFQGPVQTEKSPAHLVKKIQKMVK